LLIQGGRVIDPGNAIDALLDLRIADGHIVELGQHLEPLAGEEVIDATDAYVAPGFIDMHVHLRDPGFPEKETLVTGTAAAVRGGFTAIACMPNTSPTLDTPELIAHIATAGNVQCRIYPIASITRNRAGAELCDYSALAAAGAVAFSDDGNTVRNARVLREAARAARNIRGRFISHAEDEDLKGDAVMHEGTVSQELGLPGSPGLAEDLIVARDLLIAADTKKAWHIAHLSTRRSLFFVAEAKQRGTDVTCEVTPHHVLLTDEAVRELGAGAKVNPPLRTEDDARALRDAVRNGTIDAFATDHAPHTAAEKSGDMHTAAVGFTGLEIAVGAYAEALPDLPVSRFVSLLSTNPARILGLAASAGTLSVGAPADITIFADHPWRVDPSKFASKGKATPFSGRTLPRRVIATIVGGVIPYREFSVGAPKP
jgi:dihydroorotase